MTMKIIKFHTKTCKWCKVVEPHVRAYADEHGLEMVEVDAEVDTASADKYGVMSAPVVVFEDGGNVMAKAVGMPEIMALINR